MPLPAFAGILKPSINLAPGKASVIAFKAQYVYPNQTSVTARLPSMGLNFTSAFVYVWTLTDGMSWVLALMVPSAFTPMDDDIDADNPLEDDPEMTVTVTSTGGSTPTTTPVSTYNSPGGTDDV